SPRQENKLIMRTQYGARQWEGDNPNVKWRAITKEILIEQFEQYKPLKRRTEKEYRQLIQEGKLHLIPQDHPGWMEGRTMPTASQIADIIGMFESYSVKILGLKPYMENHNKILEAYYKFAGIPFETKDDEMKTVRLAW